MLSLLRRGFGIGHEHLSDRERITAAEKRNPHVSGVMVPGPVTKRKRGDSTQSLATSTLPPQHRPAKRGNLHQPQPQLQQHQHQQQPQPRPQLLAPQSAVVLGNKTDGVNGICNVPDDDGSMRQQSDQQTNGSPRDRNFYPQVMDIDITDQPISNNDSNNNNISNSSSNSNNNANAHAAMPVLLPAEAEPAQLSEIERTITHAFSLEILIKHDELRFIDQEIAKIQVALEQLRRCSVIPYPSLTGNLDDRLNVASGSGLSLRPSHGHTNPRHPAPWGVTDGPYTRHFSRWLLPDTEFDGGVVEEIPMSARSARAGFERRHRGSIAEHRPSFGRGRRGSVGSRLQALSSGYPVPKEDKGLAIVTRQSDKKLVKLVCMDCGRENFSSAQGFINHCRIAHSRSFASHEAAAQTVGVEIDAPPEPTVLATPTAAVSAAAQTPVSARPEISTPGGPMTPGFAVQHATVNRKAPALPALRAPVPRNRILSQATPTGTSIPTVRLPSQSAAIPAASRPSSTSTPLRPSAAPASTTVNQPLSTSTPHLSRLFAASGATGNLDLLVTEARQREDLDAALANDLEGSSSDNGDGDNEDSLFEQEDNSDAGPQLPTGLARTIPRSGMTPAASSSVGNLGGISMAAAGRPMSRKGVDRSTARMGIGTSTPVASRKGHASVQAARVPPAASIAATQRQHSSHANTDDSRRSSSNTTLQLSESPPNDLSPHTVESNNAPSLVSDDSDDSMDSDSTNSDSDSGDEDYDNVETGSADGGNATSGASASEVENDVEDGNMDDNSDDDEEEEEEEEEGATPRPEPDLEVEFEVRDRDGHHHHHGHRHHDGHGRMVVDGVGADADADVDVDGVADVLRMRGGKKKGHVIEPELGAVTAVSAAKVKARSARAKAKPKPKARGTGPGSRKAAGPVAEHVKVAAGAGVEKKGRKKK